MTTPNYERLKDAYAILDGIPEDAIHLEKIVTERGERMGCGTIACGIGWLAMHPDFNAKGLSVDSRGMLEFYGERQFYPSAASELFGVNWNDGVTLFQPRLNQEPRSHKQALLRRLRLYLGRAEQITNPEVLALYKADLRAPAAY